MSGIGETLKNARKSKGISLEQAEEDTKIRKLYLQALEEGNYDVIPGRVYARGFLRNYASYLELDQEEIMLEYKLLGMPAKEENRKVDIEQSINRRRTNDRLEKRTYLATALVSILAIATLILYNVYKTPPDPGLDDTEKPPIAQQDTNKPGQQDQKPGESKDPGSQPDSSGLPPDQTGGQPNTVSPGQNVPGDEDNGQSGAQTITLKGKDQVCWANVIVDEVVQFSGNINPGDSKTFSGNIIKLTLGNAGAVEVIQNGQSLGALGPYGKVEKRTYSE